MAELDIVASTVATVGYSINFDKLMTDLPSKFETAADDCSVFT